MRYVGVVFHNRALQSVCVKQSIYLGNSVSFEGVFHGNSSGNYSTRCNQLLTLEVTLGGERCLGGELSAQNLVTPFSFLSYMFIF